MKLNVKQVENGGTTKQAIMEAHSGFLLIYIHMYFCSVEFKDWLLFLWFFRWKRGKFRGPDFSSALPESLIQSLNITSYRLQLVKSYPKVT